MNQHVTNDISMKHKYICAIFLLALGSLMQLHAQTMQLQTNWWQPAGTVNTIVKHPTKNIAFIGGDFTSVGPKIGNNALMLDSSSGMIKYGFPGTNDTVKTIIADGHGGFFIGGSFTQVGDSLRNHIAHLDSNGQVTALFRNGGFNAAVNALILDSGKLYAAGNFTLYNQKACSHVASLNITDGSLYAWNVVVTGNVNCISLAKGTLYAAGNITKVNNISRNNVAAFSADSGNLLGWNPPVIGQVYTCIADTGSLYLGTKGSVYAVSLSQSNINWVQNQLATLNATYVRSLALLGPYLYFGGSCYDATFQIWNSRIGRLSTDSGLAVTWDFNIAGGQFNKLLVHNGRLYIGGKVGNLSATEFGGVAIYDTINGGMASWGPIFNGNVLSIAPTAGGVYIGGVFTMNAGVYRSRVAAMELSWGKPTDWSANVNGTVYSMAVADTVVYIGGNFTTVNGQARKNFAAVHIETGILLPLLANTDYAVRGFLIDGNMLYMCGNFATVNNQLRKGIAQINRATGEVLSWAPNANGNVYTIAKYNNTIYAGGSFTEIGGATRNYLAALDQNGVANGWNPNVNGGGTPLASGGVNKLLVADNLIFVGGDFDYVGNLPPTGRPVQFNLITGDLTSWRCYVGNTNNDMFIINDNLIIGSKASTKVNVVNKNTGAEKNMMPTITGTSVNAVMALGNTLLVGGSITAVDGKPVTGLAVLKSQFNVSTPTIKNNLSGINVYPNPTAGNVVISNNNNFSLQVAVYDLSGKLLVVPSMCMPRNNMELNLALSPGVYFVSIQSEQGNSMQKLIITD